MRPGRPNERGQASVEYLGVAVAAALLVIVLVGAAPALGEKVRCGVGGAVASVLGGEGPDCGGEGTPAPPASPAAVSDGESPLAKPAGPEARPLAASATGCRLTNPLCGRDLVPDGPDPGDEELYDVTFGNGVYVSVYENATGAILTLYELCDQSIECVIDELEAREIGPQEGTGAAQWNDALDEDQWEDLEEAIQDVLEDGGCLNVHVRGGINWSTRGTGDDTCQEGETITEGDDENYQVELDRDGAHVSISEDSSALLGQLSAFCQGDGACIAETLLDPPPEVEDLAPELATVLEELDASEVTRNLRDRVLSDSEHADLEGAVGEVAGSGGCLGVDVGTGGEIDWLRLAPGDPACI